MRKRTDAAHFNKDDAERPKSLAQPDEVQHPHPGEDYSRSEDIARSDDILICGQNQQHTGKNTFK